jgi:hypothetical protein
MMRKIGRRRTENIVLYMSTIDDTESEEFRYC